MIRFELPSLGADMDERTLLQWHVQPGDSVKRGQVVAVVDTAKAAVDVEIWHEGVVAELLIWLLSVKRSDDFLCDRSGDANPLPDGERDGALGCHP